MSSIFLARVIGLYFVIASIAMLIRPDHFRGLLKEVIGNGAVLFTIACITLIIGLLLVVGHNVWEGWPIVITIIGWLTLISGCVRLSYPEGIRSMSQSILHTPAYWVLMAITLIVGLFLCYYGFF